MLIALKCGKLISTLHLFHNPKHIYRNYNAAYTFDTWPESSSMLQISKLNEKNELHMEKQKKILTN